jgi:phosphonate metabolism protein PhnN/1,5-bisphosphokinase (PRPP-forming)
MECNGQLFLIVGNSGSGKDSLLKEVLKRWPAAAGPIRIPHRYITRPAHGSEPFIPVTPEDFAALNQQGKFCLTWHVYDTDYGVPVTIFNWLVQGTSVIVNVSRDIIPRARRMIPDLKVIFVSVPLDVTLQRIADRKRESEDGPGFQKRLARAKENQTLPGADFVVDNSVPLEEAAEKLVGYMLSIAN